MKKITFLMIVSLLFNSVNISAFDTLKNFTKNNLGNAASFSITTLPFILKYFTRLIGCSLHGLASSNEYFGKLRESQFKPKVSKEVQEWYTQIVNKHFNNLKLNFFVDYDGEFYSATGTDTILVGISAYLELEKALKNKDTSDSKKILAYHEAFILHEIKHLKKEYLAGILLPLATTLLNYYIFKKINSNTNQLNLNYLIKKAVSVCLVFMHYALNKYSITKIHHYLENSADYFAITKLKNEPEKIDILINFFKNNYQKLLNTLNEATNDPDSGLIMKLFNHLYKKTNKGESFATWLENHPKLFALFFYLLDSEHPNSQIRANILQQRKFELLNNNA